MVAAAKGEPRDRRVGRERHIGGRDRQVHAVFQLGVVRREQVLGIDRHMAIAMLHTVHVMLPVLPALAMVVGQQRSRAETDGGGGEGEDRETAHWWFP